MTIEFIPVRADYEAQPHISQVISLLRGNAADYGLGDGVLYYGWPQMRDYDDVAHPVDLALITNTVGLVLIRCLANATDDQAEAADASISQAAATSESQMMKSSLLRQKRRLKFEVTPVLYAPGVLENDDFEAEVAKTEAEFCDQLSQCAVNDLSSEDVSEARSILEGAKALGRPTRRRVTDPAQEQLALALSRLEEEIASFDAAQRNVALTNLNCPQRIRGLAGSGKTVILAMKAAMAHIDNPDAQILFTYCTRSLRDAVVRMITRFYRHFAEGEPNWDRIDIRHGWGRKDTPGVYRDTAVRYGRVPMALMDAKKYSADPFDYACRDLVANEDIEPFYDLILIDEGQDFPSAFYELCFHLAKGERDHKQIVWAYDELQNIFNVAVRSPEMLFGVGKDGEPNISLERALPDYAETNDFVLQKCYRNQRDVLVLAHAIGFGLYREPVQMLQNREHWEDVGYDVLEGNFVTGNQVRIERPSRNSPTSLTNVEQFPLISYCGHANMDAEVAACAQEVIGFINGGLEPHDVMVIAIDDRSARVYLSDLATSLSQHNVQVNNIIADRYSEPPFLIEGKVTMSTIHRAKGNEAAVVIVLGADAVNLRSRVGRNRLFTAFTRSKGWLRVSGYEGSSRFQQLQEEMYQAIKLSPEMHFVMPDVEQIELIQRDLKDKDARLLEARMKMDRIKEEMNLTDDDLFSVLDNEA